MAFSAALLLFIALDAAPDVVPQTESVDHAEPLARVSQTPTETVSAQEQQLLPDNHPWMQWMADHNGHDTVMQMRIQRRVVIRIPRTTSRRQPLSDIRTGQLSRNWEERKIGKCLTMNSIAGVQIASNDQMLLYLRDRRIIRAQLEKACRARDFYSGFYLEQSNDGRLCVERDVLHARSGNKCELKRIRQLVPKD
ncbi:hypothetical protein [Alterisphingorhabdus coralli]|uniref:Uncharacterized protein n=1 Tax=Alterisphingorhabdus coralli TaxID=3071408 RepID=A0AA97I1S5_9SPHN|nr:hypothetical protein [Parasphingorhabdus sp. SCSIO 66989]WOE76382.1 hypothetical protein RB602_06620 [Parasphingorhabdus sp. SCSIO 66989]